MKVAYPEHGSYSVPAPFLAFRFRPFFLICYNGTEFCSQTAFLSVLGLIIFGTSAI